MDEKRLVLAIVLSVIVFVAWQFIFGNKEAQKQAQKTQTQEQPVSDAVPEKEIKTPTVAEKSVASTEDEDQRPPQIANTITVDTSLYQVKISERGAVFESYVLKDFTEKANNGSAFKQLLAADGSMTTMELGFAGKSIPGFEDDPNWMK
jgi:YidC/Oxa1 family membrane protein insertase